MLAVPPRSSTSLNHLYFQRLRTEFTTKNSSVRERSLVGIFTCPGRRAVRGMRIIRIRHHLSNTSIFLFSAFTISARTRRLMICSTKLILQNIIFASFSSKVKKYISFCKLYKLKGTAFNENKPTQRFKLSLTDRLYRSKKVKNTFPRERSSILWSLRKSMHSKIRMGR